MVVPALSKGSGAHGVWPGIQNDNSGFVFQSVISDSKVPGTWQFFVEYCCNPDYQASAIRVYPGDSITSTFTMGANSVWTDSWSLSPGSVGQAAGQRPQAGSSSESFGRFPFIQYKDIAEKLLTLTNFKLAKGLSIKDFLPSSSRVERLQRSLSVHLDMLLVEDSNTPYQGALQLHKIPRPLVPIAALRLDELDNGAGEGLARPKTR
ncbi:hypothetical protein IFR04_003915 [Cadophora malorum]|uniref:Uncharacterized protein n=1 Tax=Cadophora malorum TaxID=108018 RepID=A0A8H7WDZ8_9HELO|nr:hypothetical protein IFR04_003915 [Cadophora malorum]